MTTAPDTRIGSGASGLFTWPAAAGIVYALAWVVGLAVWPSNLSVSASDAKVVDTYDSHEAAAVTQYLLVEGSRQRS